MSALIRTTWTEEELLDAFWVATSDLAVDRLQLLRLYSMVTVARPSTWDVAAVRAEFARLNPRPSRALPGCLACRARDRRLHRHHVIWVGHFGSNSSRNLVYICDEQNERRGASCHQTLHWWMTPRQTSHETIKTAVDAYVDALGRAILRPYRNPGVAAS